MQFDLACYKMYLDLRDFPEYVPPLRRPKANSANEDLAERLTQIGLPNNGVLECKVYSIFRVEKVQSFHREEWILIEKVMEIPEANLKGLHFETTAYILRLYSEELNCFLDYSIRDRIKKEGQHSNPRLPQILTSWMMRLEMSLIGETIGLHGKAGDYLGDGKFQKILDLSGELYHVPDEPKVCTEKIVRKKRVEVFGEELVNAQEEFFPKPKQSNP